MKQEFDIKGMTCSACSSHVQKCVNSLDGIINANVNLLTNSMIVEFDETKTNIKLIIDAVNTSGYTALLKSNKANINKNDDSLKPMKNKLVSSIILLLVLMYVSMSMMFKLPLLDIINYKTNPLNFVIIQLLLAIPVIIINRNYFIKGFKTLFKRHPNMDSLIAIGSSASFLYSIYSLIMVAIAINEKNTILLNKHLHDLYFESSAMILTLITLGKYFEAKSKMKTTEAISKLMNLAPKEALIIKDGVEKLVNIDDLQVGDIIIVKPGNSIPCDGLIIDGESYVDESMLTGESMPVEKKVDSKVIGGTINQLGTFKFIATDIGNETTLSKIIKLVKEAGNSKAPMASLADKVAGYFVPTVMLISLITFIIWILVGKTFSFSLMLAVSVLVISCPCALGLATPVAIMVGTGKGAENGILIKNATGLEASCKIQCVVLDKTGTITEGKPSVQDIFTKNINKNDAISIVSSLEKSSEHPISKAFAEYSMNNNISIKEVTNFTSISGYGISGIIDRKKYYVGSLKLMTKLNINIDDFIDKYSDYSLECKTIIFLADKDNILALFTIQDSIKESSYIAINKLIDMNIDVVMLTGDQKSTAEAIAKKLNIKNVICEVLPDEKSNHISKLKEKYNCVAMVGDGINDSPALVSADVGFAIGAGSDIAIDSADIILMKSDLRDVVAAIELSKKVVKNIKQNLFWAFFYNCIGIPIAAGVFYPFFKLKLSPMIGSLAMSFSSVFVVLNALRLRFFKPNFSIKTSPTMTDKKYCKIVHIKGMMCENCKTHVYNALLKVTNNFEVILEKNIAIIYDQTIDDKTIKNVIKEAGYKVSKITMR